uniref:Putative secreted protein fat body overexpressed n=1 Tax=Rhipicephalus microplus TaxID=6941 RepID=A0A6M2DEH1_RHIMP
MRMLAVAVVVLAILMMTSGHTRSGSNADENEATGKDKQWNLKSMEKAVEPFLERFKSSMLELARKICSYLN